MEHGDGRPAPFRFASGKAKNLIRHARRRLAGPILSILLILSKRTMEKVFNSFKGLTGSTGFSGSFFWSFSPDGRKTENPPAAEESSVRSSGRYRRHQGHLKHGDGRPAPFRFSSGEAKNLVRHARRRLAGPILSILSILSKKTMEKVFNSFKGLTGLTGFSGFHFSVFLPGWEKDPESAYGGGELRTKLRVLSPAARSFGAWRWSAGTFSLCIRQSEKSYSPRET